MNLKNCKYMDGEEFKGRQGSFGFFCAQAVEFLTTFRNECRAGWRKLFTVRREIKKPVQLNLDFVRKLTDWANWSLEKNLEIFG